MAFREPISICSQIFESGSSKNFFKCPQFTIPIVILENCVWPQKTPFFLHFSSCVCVQYQFLSAPSNKCILPPLFLLRRQTVTANCTLVSKLDGQNYQKSLLYLFIETCLHQNPLKLAFMVIFLLEILEIPNRLKYLMPWTPGH